MTASFKRWCSGSKWVSCSNWFFSSICLNSDMKQKYTRLALCTRCLTVENVAKSRSKSRSFWEKFECYVTYWMKLNCIWNTEKQANRNYCSQQRRKKTEKTWNCIGRFLCRCKIRWSIVRVGILGPKCREGNKGMTRLCRKFIHRRWTSFCIELIGSIIRSVTTTCPAKTSFNSPTSNAKKANPNVWSASGKE